MTAAEVLALLRDAVAVGQAFESIIPWAKQRHPTLRTEPLPDAEGEMLAARKAAEGRG